MQHTEKPLEKSFSKAGKELIHDRENMRRIHSVEMGRVGLASSGLEKNSSGGVSLVRWCRIGLWDDAWDLFTH